MKMILSTNRSHVFYILSFHLTILDGIALCKIIENRIFASWKWQYLNGMKWCFVEFLSLLFWLDIRRL